MAGEVNDVAQMKHETEQEEREHLQTCMDRECSCWSKEGTR